MKKLFALLIVASVGCNSITKNDGYDKMKPILMNINSLHYKDYTDGFKMLETYYGKLVTIDVYEYSGEVCLTTSNDSMASLIKRQLFDSAIKFTHFADERGKNYGFTVHQITYHKYSLPTCLTQTKLK